eukprot:CAMPEP_0204347940 /NCGR_PEP_ID=MMETSP0469-20131031/28344_1 /ASSEMBLY_ACC=CAM_ASM_000384 /TAXON_ID=2969 /ORGANISM="Oxyrrhis marina" /LENGTH=316 /DNA_ID=CAMNT_0051333821 /DNA_START=9 /DNA_END=959 /DNA_ORIENTATION=-
MFHPLRAAQRCALQAARRAPARAAPLTRGFATYRCDLEALPNSPRVIVVGMAKKKMTGIDSAEEAVKVLTGPEAPSNVFLSICQPDFEEMLSTWEGRLVVPEDVALISERRNSECIPAVQRAIIGKIPVHSVGRSKDLASNRLSVVLWAIPMDSMKLIYHNFVKSVYFRLKGEQFRNYMRKIAPGACFVYFDERMAVIAMRLLDKMKHVKPPTKGQSPTVLLLAPQDIADELPRFLTEYSKKPRAERLKYLGEYQTLTPNRWHLIALFFIGAPLVNLYLFLEVVNMYAFGTGSVGKENKWGSREDSTLPATSLLRK